MTASNQDSFHEIKPPLAVDQALAEANRCLNCYDAPCTKACPTHIDVPGFIKKIGTGNLRGSARVIFEANVLGASCARVCPTEVLCEGACVMDDVTWKPIQIGQLQRYATDFAMARGILPFTKSPVKKPGRVAIIGAGPSGLACAAELLRVGHEAVIFDAGEKPGGLNTYGVAEYKMTPAVALAEVAQLQKAGVEIRSGVRVGQHISIAELETQFDAIFVGVGLGRIGKIGLAGENLDGVVDAMDYIAELKIDRAKAETRTRGRRVVVIGGGNTSIDVVTQAQRLGAAEVHLVYRRGPEELPAYAHEVELAKQSGCRFVFLSQPVRVVGNGKVEGLVVQRMRLGAPGPDGRRKPEPVVGEELTLAADLIVPATGQEARLDLLKNLPNVKLDRNRPVVNSDMQTSNPKYFAGGDCVSGGQEVVNAVAEGKRAAAGIVKFLQNRQSTVDGRQFGAEK